MSSSYELLPPSDNPAEQKDMGIEEQHVKSEVRGGDGVAQLVALAASGTTLIITWIAVSSNSPTKIGWFAFHPPLQTLALFLFTYGILTLQPTSQPKTKAAGFQRHQFAIFFMGVPAITFGTLSVMYNKWLRDAEHFKTWHGTFGLLCMLWIGVQIAIGGGSVWFNGAAFGGSVKAKALWKYHRLSGYILFPMLLFTVNLGGAWSHWGQKNTSSFVRILAFVIAPAAVLTALYSRVRTSKMKFF